MAYGRYSKVFLVPGRNPSVLVFDSIRKGLWPPFLAIWQLMGS